MRRLFFLGLITLLPAAQAGELVVLVDTANDMPMARFERYRLVDGIHRDIGVALAQHMQRSARFMSLPRKRLVRALEDGSADVLCSYVPEWLDGRLHWSQAFIPIAEVLVSARSAPRPRSVDDVAGKPVGTVLGYAHPEMEALLGARFVRADGPTADANLRKLAAGRIEYALTGKSFLEWRQKNGALKVALHPPLVVKNYMGQCAVSPKGRVTLAEVDLAITQMVKEGKVGTILAKYQ
ncbi:ABC transporter substrate-binding protein [Massilia sp. CF038]|uniref:substrate-binding periplasmic protein n=1 Tax=Massilia sp. CF038 TaxID=1881045 RepID=UPI00091874FF|nr:ABC transporter substrate-binding protein [Massilia sp. CF038]SHH12544.1 amino acid ABC transporter substrate-binding protein, PAAT family [Massilia sp. CF038]